MDMPHTFMFSHNRGNNVSRRIRLRCPNIGCRVLRALTSGVGCRVQSTYVQSQLRQRNA